MPRHFRLFSSTVPVFDSTWFLAFMVNVVDASVCIFKFMKPAIVLWLRPNILHRLVYISLCFLSILNDIPHIYSGINVALLRFNSFRCLRLFIVPWLEKWSLILKRSPIEWCWTVDVGATWEVKRQNIPSDFLRTCWACYIVVVSWESFVIDLFVVFDAAAYSLWV